MARLFDVTPGSSEIANFDVHYLRTKKIAKMLYNVDDKIETSRNKKERYQNLKNGLMKKL